MKVIHACATAACLVWATGASNAHGEQAIWPTLLALPDVYGPSDDGPQVAPQYAGYYDVEPIPANAPPSTAPDLYDAWATIPANYRPAHPLPRPVGSMTHLGVGEPGSSEDWLAYKQGTLADEVGPEDRGDECPPCAPCAPVCCRPAWYGGMFGLFMGRDRGNRFWTSAQSNNNFNQVLNTQDADTNFRGGGEVTFGRWFGCDCACGLQATYWTLDPWRGFASLSQAQTGFFLNTPIDLQLVTIGGVPATNYFDGAFEHFISRRDELHNFEVNLWKPLFYGPGQAFEMGCLAGVRYFRFNEDLLFGSVAGGSMFDDNGGADEAYLDTNVINNLVGFQIGSRANWWMTPLWSIYCQPMVGVFGNHLSHQMRLYRGDGAAGFDLQSTANDVSLLGQLDLGVQRRFGRNCSLYAGYRVLGISGIALADAQIPPFLIDSPVILDIDSNANLIVHGGVFGVMWNY